MLTGFLIGFSDVPPNPTTWLGDKNWTLLCSFAKVSYSLDELPQHVKDNSEAWQEWFLKDEPQDEPMPEPFEEKDAFRKMLIMRAFRPEKVMYSIQL